MLYCVEYIDEHGKTLYFASTDLHMTSRITRLISENNLEITDFKAVDFNL